MSAHQYRRALEAAQGEYEQLMRQRADIDRRLAQLVQTIGTLSRLCHLTPAVGLGLTDACRMALKAAGHPLSGRQIRAHLEAMGFDVSKYSNPLASIQTVLKRLQEAGPVEFSSRVFKKPVYGPAEPGAKRPLAASAAHPRRKRSK
jgi:hypothetical protein